MGRSKTDEMRGSLEGFEASFKGSYGALLSVRGAVFRGECRDVDNLHDNHTHCNYMFLETPVFKVEIS